MLQAHGRLTAQDLAERLEVSVRTVYRDLDALSAAGVPVYAESGPGGGVALPDGYRLDLTALNRDEANALFLSAAPSGAGPLADLGVGTVLDGALRKLSAALPPASRDAAERARQRLLVDPVGWWEEPAVAPPCLRVVEEAVWQDRRLRFTYTRFGAAPAVRVVDPYALVVQRGVWYLVATIVRDGRESDPQDEVQDGRREGQRDGERERQREGKSDPVVFRVSRMAEASILDAASRRDPDFDLPAFWERSRADFLATRPRYPVTLRATLAAARMLLRTFGPGMALPDPDEDGRVTLTLNLEWLEVALGNVLPHGADVEVLDPPELRDRLAHTAAALSALYSARSQALT
jgi:predicted DNA-binding transcriptional regulator YafY